MTAAEVMVLARSGELRQLSSSIKDDDATVIAFMNLGMTEIYKRFMLKTYEAIITLVNGKTIYKLDGTDVDVDMGGGEMLYLVAAYGSGINVDDYTVDDIVLPINTEDDPYSINTITYNQVQIPLITAGATISIIYVAKPTKVTSLNLDQEIDMPDTYVEALLSYIGYRGYTTMGDKGPSEDDVFYSKFEKACNKVRELGVGIAPDDFEMRDKLRQRCFV